MNSEAMISTEGESEQQQIESLIDSARKRYDDSDAEFGYPLQGPEDEASLLPIDDLVQVCGTAIIRIKNQRILTAAFDSHRSKAVELFEKGKMGEFDVLEARKRGQAAVKRAKLRSGE